MRKKRLILNTATSIINQLVTIICGFILPKLILDYYGSAVNGLIASITQFLAFITFLELGVGAVVETSLYKPLANNDKKKISEIIKSADKFFKKIAYILLIYTIILAIVYPIMINEFNYLYTFTLILIISISLFSQYYFGIKYQLLLNADQKSYIQIGIQTITLLLNTVVCVILIKKGFSIHTVKLVTAIFFILRPIILWIYAKKHYSIDKGIQLIGEPIKQKWNGLAQHLASVVLGNTDVVTLTLFSTLQNISIYSVYNLVVLGIRQLILSITTGISSLFGNMLANNERELLMKTFDKFEMIMHFLITVIFTCSGMLILPFVRIYTQGISDVNYIVPEFAILITIAQGVYCLRLPYNIMVLAAGHYKQTQNSAIIEMILNIVISVIGVINFGLVGVALGTFIAMMYRTIYLANYLKDNIISRRFDYFIKHILVDCLVVILSIILCKSINFDVTTYIDWIFLSVKVGVTTLAIGLIINLVFYRKVIFSILKKSNKFKI